MESLIDLISWGLAGLTVVGGVWLILMIIFSSLKQGGLVVDWFKKRALKGAFGVSLLATLGSLFYSEIAHLTPCRLCWFQRIFMYPLPIILGIGLLKKEKGVFKYGLALSLIGVVIALYHYWLQVGGVESVTCGVVGYSPSCSNYFFLRFGYITIAMMSLTAFSIVSLLLGWTGEILDQEETDL